MVATAKKGAALKAELKAQNEALKKNNAETKAALERLGNEPNRRGKSLGTLFGSQGPHVTSGKLGERPYSFLKAVGLFKGWINEDEAKEESHYAKELETVYRNDGFRKAHANGLLVPICTAYLPVYSDHAAKLQAEIRQKMYLDPRMHDPSEISWFAKKYNVPMTKAMGTLSDTAGGSWVPPPMFGEFIDLQRNAEAWSNAGATQVALPSNNTIQYPKLTGASTAYYKGEQVLLTESQQKSGDLELSGKKLTVLVKTNNELFRFNAVGAESVMRNDMALQSAQKFDQAQFNGTGGTMPLGFDNYPAYDTDEFWTQGDDRILSYEASDPQTNGDYFQPQDYTRMASKLPTIVTSTAFIQKRTLWGFTSTRRADATTSGDEKGTFVNWWSMVEWNGVQRETVNGQPIIMSENVPGNEVKGGSGATLTEIICGAFRDWFIARLGVMELVPNMYATDAYTYDQTWLRAIQFNDAGPRHLASFCKCQNLVIG